jgi:hypothetical protein
MGAGKLRLAYIHSALAARATACESRAFYALQSGRRSRCATAPQRRAQYIFEAQTSQIRLSPWAALESSRLRTWPRLQHVFHDLSSLLFPCSSPRRRSWMIFAYSLQSMPAGSTAGVERGLLDCRCFCLDSAQALAHLLPRVCAALPFDAWAEPPQYLLEIPISMAGDIWLTGGL